LPIEIAVNNEFLPGKFKLFCEIAEKIKICRKLDPINEHVKLPEKNSLKICLEKLNFFKITCKKSKFFGNLP